MNLGTPDAPTASAVRRYLAEFLSDRRVVEIPAFVWKLILHGVILRVRPARSAKKYAMIWGADGSPLLAHSQKQKTLLMGYLGQRLKDAGLPSDLAPVELAMRYGNPGIADAIGRLKAAGCDRILVVPLFPQYSASATAAALDAVFAHAQRLRRMPGLRTVDCFHDDPGYIKALARNVSDYWMRHGRPDMLVMSFHGLPRRALDLGDPYHCQCHKTARLLAAELGPRAEAVRRDVPVALRAGRVAEAVHAGHARSARPGRGRARRRRLPGIRRPTASRRWRRSASRSSRRSSAPADASSTRSRASTSIRRGSPRWSSSSWRTSRAGSPRRRMRPRARRRCCGRRRSARGSDPAGVRLRRAILHCKDRFY